MSARNLVVEDNDGNRRLMRILLRTRGYEVIDNATGEIGDFWEFCKIEGLGPPIREICQREGITFETMRFPDYYSNAVLLLDHQYVIKISPPQFAEFIEIEAGMLKALEQQPNIPAPRLVAEGVFEDRITWSYIIMEYVSGDPMNRARKLMSRDNFLAITEHLGKIVRDFVQIDIASVPFLPPLTRTWNEALAQDRELAIEELQRDKKIPRKLHNMLLDFLASNSAEQWIDIDSPPVLNNDDLSSEHLYVVERDGWWEIAGIIDFAETRLWLPEYQLMHFYGSLGQLNRDPEAMRAFLKSYDPDYINEDFGRMCMFLFLTCRFCNGAFSAISGGFVRSGSHEFSSFQEYQDWYFPPIPWGE